MRFGATIFKRSKKSATDYAHETQALKEYLENIYPELKKHFLQDVLRFAVNQEYVSENLNLRPIDEIAIFPPVSGG